MSQLGKVKVGQGSEEGVRYLDEYPRSVPDVFFSSCSSAVVKLE